ncbi:hypothetical protein LDENG_00164790 [Lucifuga dentata]|nr:hypothetical protein LDENG_00164790 [Lucifuga dentata]
MAEAAAATPQHRFFCHCCKCETNPKLPDFVCPRCESGFIEEVTEDSSLLEESTTVDSEETSTFLSDLWQLLFMERSALLSHPPSSESDPDTGVPEARELESSSQPGQERSSRPEQMPAVEGIVQQFLAGLFANNGNPGASPATLTSMLQLHSNPADYAWGQGGLDTVITGLLGQLENTGPPPAEKDMISSLPTVYVSQEQTDCRLECPVCREEYSFGESVKQLPCLHYFHSDCIVPWLELHDTCPVCRKSLDGVDNSLPPTAEPPDTRSIRTDQQERQAI